MVVITGLFATAAPLLSCRDKTNDAYRMLISGRTKYIRLSCMLAPGHLDGLTTRTDDTSCAYNIVTT
jgi:hypothetical protein